MKLNFNFESRENHFLTSGISHPGWYLSPRFTVYLTKLNYISSGSTIDLFSASQNLSCSAIGLDGLYQI